MGIEIVKEVYSLASCLPMNERNNLESQISRSAVSISSNIAEGGSRSCTAEYKRFLEISLGSAFELETQLINIQTLQLYPGYHFELVYEKLNHEQRMIGSMITRISNDLKK